MHGSDGLWHCVPHVESEGICKTRKIGLLVLCPIDSVLLHPQRNKRFVQYSVSFARYQPHVAFTLVKKNPEVVMTKSEKVHVWESKKILKLTPMTPSVLRH